MVQDMEQFLESFIDEDKSDQTGKRFFCKTGNVAHLHKSRENKNLLFSKKEKKIMYEASSKKSNSCIYTWDFYVSTQIIVRDLILYPFTFFPWKEDLTSALKSNATMIKRIRQIHSPIQNLKLK